MSADGWREVPVYELLTLDPRPVFVLDISRTPSIIVFLNPAAHSFKASEESIVWTGVGDAAAHFKEWMISDPLLTVSNYRYRGSWTTVVLRSRWKVVTGNWKVPESNTPSQASQQHLDPMVPISKSFPTSLDWTAGVPPRAPTPFTRFLLEFDWSKTPFGPSKEWALELRLMINLVLV
jgi:hypothetical protein